MKQTKAAVSPSPSPKPNKANTEASNPAASTSLFLGMALDMSWRLAVCVLVPIIGGFELDKALKTSPLFAIVGFLLAMVGMYIVMKQTLKIANNATNNLKGSNK